MPGMKHFTAGSRFSQFFRFSARCSAAHGWYGIVPPSTTLSPAGMAPSAPSASTGPWRAAWASKSQCADPIACQIPFRSGWPSGVRDAAYWADACVSGAGHSSTMATSIPATEVLVGIGVLRATESAWPGWRKLVPRPSLGNQSIHAGGCLGSLVGLSALALEGSGRNRCRVSSGFLRSLPCLVRGGALLEPACSVEPPVARGLDELHGSTGIGPGVHSMGYARPSRAMRGSPRVGRTPTLD